MPKKQKIWDQRWTDRNYSDGWTPDSWLVKHRYLLDSGEALDIACGRGRNALFLAESGYLVTAIDYSSVALQQLQQKSRQCGQQVETMLWDLEQQSDLPQKQFDLIINFFYLNRPILPQLIQNVKPGGLAIIRTFTTAGNGAPCQLGAEMALNPGELKSHFTNWDILIYEEGLEPSKKGGTLVGLIARKPLK